MKTSLRIVVGAALFVLVPTCGGKAKHVEEAHPDKGKDYPTAIDWIAIPAGHFAMGCTTEQGCSPSDAPHDETVAAFSMAHTLTTVASYFKCVDAGACPAPRATEKTCNGRDRYDHPINCMSYWDALKFCEWSGGRLPTATEWEYAARSDDGRLYPWGNDPPTTARARFDVGLDEGTDPVTAHLAGASKWGLLDMAGNLRQWTSTYYEPKPPDKEYRGCAWFCSAERLRSPLRDGSLGDSTGPDVGFRCAK